MIKEYIKSNKRILIHFYYTGHGKMKEQTYAVLNNPDFKKAMFPIERKIRNLSLFGNTSVYALLECCREQMRPGEEMPLEKQVHLRDSKGEKVDPALYVTQEANKSQELFTITFGCQPTYGVARGSCLGPKYIAHLQAFANKNNNRVVLPMALVDFNDSEKQSETIIKCPL